MSGGNSHQRAIERAAAKEREESKEQMALPQPSIPLPAVASRYRRFAAGIKNTFLAFLVQTWNFIKYLFVPWITLSSNRLGKSQKPEIGAGVAAVLLAVVPWAYAMSVEWRWGIWFVCWVAAVCILARIKHINRLALRTRVVLGLLVVVLFPWALGDLAFEQWRTERASATDGTLSAPRRRIFQKPKTSPTFPDVGAPLVKFGPDAPSILFVNITNDPGLKFFYDAGLRIELGPDGDWLVSTPIRDSAGNVVAHIENNVWHVPSTETISVDKNYNGNSLEVQDHRGHVVFQLTFLPEVIEIQGEWHDDRGHSIRMMQPTRSDELITPMFEYPSKKHWAEVKGQRFKTWTEKARYFLQAACIRCD
jgi:hypothetical protein